MKRKPNPRPREWWMWIPISFEQCPELGIKIVQKERILVREVLKRRRKK